jgi:hypothetical protein
LGEKGKFFEKTFPFSPRPTIPLKKLLNIVIACKASDNRKRFQREIGSLREREKNFLKSFFSFPQNSKYLL